MSLWKETKFRLKMSVTDVILFYIDEGLSSLKKSFDQQLAIFANIIMRGVQ